MKSRLVRALNGFAKERVGALVVVRGKDLLIRHIEGGDDLDGKLSESILWSIFDPHSIGHDGAVIIEHNRIQKLGCHLPLSKNLDKLKRGGTRHAAALGLSELTDALCLVVSEERGTISVARRGEIEVVEGAEKLTEIVESFFQEVAPRKETNYWQDLLKKNSREKLLAIGIAVALWCVLVYPAKESPIVERTFSVPSEPVGLGSGMEVVSIEPSAVALNLSGPRREFFSLKPVNLKVVLKLSKLEKGEHVVSVTPEDIVLPPEMPDEIHFKSVDPPVVSVVIVETRPKNP